MTVYFIESPNKRSIAIPPPPVSERSKRAVPLPTSVAATTRIAPISCILVLTILMNSLLSKQAQAFSFVSKRGFLTRPIAGSTGTNSNNRGILHRGVESVSSSPAHTIITPLASTSSSRLYSFNRYSSSNNNNRNNNNNNDEKEGLLTKLKNKAKQYLPFLRSDEEKQAAMEKRRVKSEIQSSMKEALRDAPFPIRAAGGMLGSMVGSMLGSAMSELAQAASEQKQTADQYYSQAVQVITSSSSVKNAMNSQTIKVGSIISQSSSTTNINGKSMTQMQFGFPVFAGDSGISAQAQLSVQSNQEPSLQLRLSNGQVMSVPMTTSSRFSSGANKKFGSGAADDDEIIEAEIIEKKSTR